MSKTTNKCQLRILLNLMESHREIACGFHKGSKEEVQVFWHTAENELNLSGPPTKNTQEWKKVWSDQKKYVRAKAAMNLKARNVTGGGANMEQKFSDYEQAIYNLIGMKESIEGVPARTFGLKTGTNTENFESQAPVDIPDGNEDELQELLIETLCEEPQPTPRNPTQQFFTSPQAQTSAPKRSAAEAFEKELIIQKELSESVNSLVVEVREMRRKIFRGLENIDRSQNKNNKERRRMKKEKIEELKRHNLYMEELRKQEIESRIEHNRRIIEIEELKLKLKE